MQHLNLLLPRKLFITFFLGLLFFSISPPSFAAGTSGNTKLKINFPGLKSVHTEIRSSDGIAGSANGKLVKKSNWKNNSTTVTVPKGKYDLVIKKGGGKLILDNVNCSSSTCNVNNIVANLSVNFAGLKNVHSSVHLPDGSTGKATGKEINKKNWQNNKAVIPLLRQIVDLKVRKGAGEIVVDAIDCRSEKCSSGDLTANLTVKFPGLKSVHTSVRVADKVFNEASGKEVTKKNWQNNQAKIIVLKNEYDLIIKLGSSSLIIDDVDCLSGTCLVDNLQSTLTVEFPGLKGVHTSVRQSDNTPNSASGKEVTKKNWQDNKAVISLFSGTYDLVIRKGNDTLIVDDISCIRGSCLVKNITAKMEVNFPGLDAIHTSIFPPDGTANSVSGKKITHKNWQKDQVILTVFKKTYDVSIKRKKSAPIIKDGVDCSSGQCKISNLVAKLTVNFPRMKGVHTSVRQPDNEPGKADGAEFNKKNWQKDQVEITVMRQKYDLKIKTNNSDPIIIDNLDCTSGACNVDQITTSLTVKFPGMTSVHTSAFIPDGKKGQVAEKQAFKLNGQKEQAVLTVFKQKFDVSVRRGKSNAIIIDDVDCTKGPCLVDNIIATLTVNFPGLKSTHTSVRIPDKVAGKADGNEVTKKNWQKEKAIITVFRQIYDIRVKNGDLTKIIDNVDCLSGTCNVTDLVSVLSIQFPGLQSVHSSAHIPDGKNNTVTGKQVAKSNWKTHQTIITLLRETYDVKVKHIVESIFDNVDCTGPSCNVLITGNVQTTLINGDLNIPIADKSLTAYEKLADGKLKKVTKGKTTAKGKVNFTLEGIKSGKVYVLKTYNPLGNKKSFFSTFITQEGAHQFIVTKDGQNSLDLTPPVIAITSPQQADKVSGLGFKVLGTATDNRQIDRIELTVIDPVKGSNLINGIYDAATNSWSADIPSSMITLNNDIVLTATAFDLAQSQNSSTITVNIVEDTEGPIVTFSSHLDNDQVPVTGFLLSGTVTDLTGVATLKATLVDTTLGQTINNQDVDFSVNNGVWTLVVNNGVITVGETVGITLNATDTIGNAGFNTIQLSVVAVNFSNSQMINRITFGATPALIQEVNTIGASSFLEQQLSPVSIDDSAFTSLLTINLPSTKEELQEWTVMHMAYSKRQLLEVMTWFWDNHFNTDINTKRNNAQGVELSNSVAFELLENQNFRANALGNFRDLLGISAKSSAMLIYLDSISNVAGDSNENYPREVYELHTMGVNGGYTDKDVENGAEIFTGWHINNNSFFFDNNLHTVGSYQIFEGTPEEVTIAQGGVIQGEQLLDALATHPSTANFICSKLITLFVNDTPPSSLVSRCTLEFINFASANDQIERVVRLIMQSVEFNDIANYRSKIKTPVEFVVGAVRNLNATSNGVDLVPAIRAMGIRLYEYPVPTGFSEIGADWINASLLIERIKWVNSFVRNGSSTNVSSSNPLVFYPNNGFETAVGITGFLFDLTVGDDFTQLSLDNALNILGNNFDITLPGAEMQLRQMNGNVMSYPHYQFQ